MKLTFKINKSPAVVFDYLSDMQKFVSVHHVISKMDELGANNYLVYETLKMGFIPVSFTYPVTVEGFRTDLSIRIKATVMKVTKIEMLFKINEENGTSVVEEVISFSSPLPVKRIMQRIFRTQHELLFKNIGLLN